MNSSPSSAPAVIDRLKQLSLAGPNDFFWDPLHLELARLYEQRGDAAKALDVLRRRRYSWSDADPLLTTYLREEGRLAAKLGDRGGATRALRHFLVLREGADEALRPQSDSARAWLASVESRSSRHSHPRGMTATAF